MILKECRKKLGTIKIILGKKICELLYNYYFKKNFMINLTCMYFFSRFYDECLYAPYHFPLVSGINTAIASSYAVNSPNGHSFMDRQIENYENNNDMSQYFPTEENLEGGERSEED